MFRFLKKKKTYLLTWCYYSTMDFVYTDIIRARDPAEVWKKHKFDHPISTYMIKLEEL